MALVGENGAGKSTMMKVLTGIYTRDAGSLLWLGKETTFNGPKSSQKPESVSSTRAEFDPATHYRREHFSWP